MTDMRKNNNAMRVDNQWRGVCNNRFMKTKKKCSWLDLN